LFFGFFRHFYDFARQDSEAGPCPSLMTVVNDAGRFNRGIETHDVDGIFGLSGYNRKAVPSVSAGHWAEMPQLGRLLFASRFQFKPAVFGVLPAVSVPFLFLTDQLLQCF
jgi:hypothetical protein